MCIAASKPEAGWKSVVEELSSAPSEASRTASLDSKRDKEIVLDSTDLLGYIDLLLRMGLVQPRVVAVEVGGTRSLLRKTSRFLRGECELETAPFVFLQS